uniref:Heterokaryon incompatibility domain-containing protein n=1 Tax=Bionectria ochroleuca TaxID=29856 RepID=A0A8H7K7J1_BIOOC
MRLLNVSTLEFESFPDPKTRPEYTILSHTWEDEEVTFQEFQRPTRTIQSKAGYTKIKLACEQAIKHGLQYAWVDTCCIDKSSSTELSEAINSMFRWYEKSRICFAFLIDVQPGVDAYDPDSAFATSRWFTRGWTLQELVAPKRVDFFSMDWGYIGSRDELAAPIQRITSINEFYLVDHHQWPSRQNLLCTASVAERMSWAARRTTTREEDAAYCMFGMFDISMPLVPGEGARAFQRIQEEILKHSFDPSLLAWDLDSMSAPVDFEVKDSHSTHRSMLRMFVGLQHPWYANTLQIWDGCQRQSLLAPSLQSFRNSGDIESARIARDWRTTNEGVCILLPKSDDRYPYIVLPCHKKATPWALLALPVIFDSKSQTYARSSLPAVWVDVVNWHRWPLKQITLSVDTNMKRGSSPRSSGGEVLLRHLPENLRLLEYNLHGNWKPGPRTKAKSQVLLPLSLPESGFLILALSIQSQATGKIATVIIRFSAKNDSLAQPTSPDTSTQWLDSSKVVSYNLFGVSKTDVSNFVEDLRGSNNDAELHPVLPANGYSKTYNNRSLSVKTPGPLPDESSTNTPLAVNVAQDSLLDRPVYDVRITQAEKRFYDPICHLLGFAWTLIQMKLRNWMYWMGDFIPLFSWIFFIITTCSISEGFIEHLSDTPSIYFSTNTIKHILIHGPSYAMAYVVMYNVLPISCYLLPTVLAVYLPSAVALGFTFRTNNTQGPATHPSVPGIGVFPLEPDHRQSSRASFHHGTLRSRSNRVFEVKLYHAILCFGFPIRSYVI